MFAPVQMSPCYGTKVPLQGDNSSSAMGQMHYCMSQSDLYLDNDNDNDINNNNIYVAKNLNTDVTVARSIKTGQKNRLIQRAHFFYCDHHIIKNYTY